MAIYSHLFIYTPYNNAHLSLRWACNYFTFKLFSHNSFHFIYRNWSTFISQKARTCRSY